MLAQRPLAQRTARGPAPGPARPAGRARRSASALGEVDDRDLGRHRRQRRARRDQAAGASTAAASMPASTSRSTAITSRWSAMKPSSTSSEVYSARWRTVSCGSARNTGPTS